MGTQRCVPPGDACVSRTFVFQTKVGLLGHRPSPPLLPGGHIITVTLEGRGPSHGLDPSLLLGGFPRLHFE